MGLFGFGKKKEKAPACACQCGCPTTEVDVSEAVKEAGNPADGALCVKVLGAGCASCHTLLENTKEAVVNLGLGIDVEYVDNMGIIAGYGVMSIPALVVDGKVVSYGKVLKPEDIAEILKKVRG